MSQDKPLMIELFAGLHGWGEAAVAEGYRVVSYDIVDMCELLGLLRPKGIELILRDVRSITGEECKDAAVIVASPPCQGYSYRAMPWKRAKALPPPDNTLFNECFRIKREASEAAGHYIPLIVENVRGAQKWVGRARANYGSFYLWGDVGMVGRNVVPIVYGKLADPISARKVAKVSGFRFDGEPHGSFQTAAVRATSGAKTPAGNCSAALWKDREISRYAHPTPEEMEAHGFTDGRKVPGSRSDSRKAASAMIAKIPYPLASHIARCFYPAEVQP